MKTKRQARNQRQYRYLCWKAFIGIALALFVATCTPDTHPDAPVALLQARFPAHADRVLGAAGGSELVAAADGNGFVPAPPAGADPVKAARAALTARGGLRSSFPRKGDGVVRFSLPDGFAIEARERGPRGAGRIQGNALVYDHGEGAGTSFWNANASGLEEWLLVPASGETPVATWDVTGATLRQNGEAVDVIDGRGAARLSVTAPAAYAESGAPLRTRLRADGVRLALSVEGPVGAGLVLVDPAWQVTGSLATARHEHTATLLPSGKVLLAGGQGTGNIALASAEVYDPVVGTFAPTTGPLATTRYNHTATLLPSGKVLLAGGYNGSILASAELYDPVAGTFAPTTGPLATARQLHTATLLPSGKVLIAAGWGTGPLTSAELYDPVAGTFAPTTGSLANGRGQFTATLLPSGKVLIAGGQSHNGSFYFFLASAELYDPATDTFATTGSLAYARYWHTATLLPSGKVLVAGGYNNWDGYPAWAEVYDPVAGTFATTTGPLATARCIHTATLLPSGKVLLAAGYNYNIGFLASAELYDPAAGTFAPTTESLATPRYYHTATLLPSGKVLLAGGANSTGVVASAELYDPTAGTFAPTAGTLATARYFHTATLLPSGKVLLAGGSGWTGNLASAELYDPTADTFAPTAGTLATARYNHTATLLPSGKVLLAGGYNDSTGFLASAELYDPLAGTFAPTAAPLATARQWHTATLLPSGKVLLAGGQGSTGNLASAELYDPTAGTFAPTAGTLATARYLHTATLLPAGKVLLAGGSYCLASAELYDPTAGTFAPTAAPLATGRSSHTATLLPSGKVLLAGGYNNNAGGNLASAELYDPTAGTFAPTAGTLATARYFHTATLLPAGKVLLAGGLDSGYLASAELYDPLAGTFAPTAGTLATARTCLTATLLPAGKVLLAGGMNGGYLASAELYDEGRGALPAWTPTLAGPLPMVIPGGTLALAGTYFTGVSAGSSGTTQTSDTNFPLLLVIRVDNQQLAYAPITGFTATSATAAIPATLLPGPYVAWVVVNGVLSNGVGLLIPQGAPDNVTASDGAYTDKVQIVWTAPSGATEYQVHRNTSNSSSGATQIGAPSATSYDDTTAEPGTTYYYFVKACNEGGCSDFSTSDSGYRAAPTLTLTVTSPNGSESWVFGSTHDLTWDISSPVSTGAFNMWIIDGDGNWLDTGGATVLAEAGKTQYSASWSVNVPVRSGYKLTVYYRPDANVWGGWTANDISDSDFAVTSRSTSSLTVTSPNGTESWANGSTQNLTWEISSPVSTGAFNMWLVDGGGNWLTTVGTVLAEAGKTQYSASWYVNVPVRSDYKLTVYYRPDANVWGGWTANDLSDSDFAVTISLTVTSPNGSESWAPGSTHDLTWEISSPVSTGAFNMWLIDGDGNWLDTGGATVLAEAGKTQYSASWSVNVPVRSGYKLTVYYRPDANVWGGWTASDISDNDFAVTSSSTLTLTVTSPNGSESWVSGSTHDLTWDISSPVSTGAFNMWIIDGDGNWLNTVGTVLAEAGKTQYSASWQVNVPVRSDYKLTVYYRPDANVWGGWTASDLSDNSFSVTQ